MGTVSTLARMGIARPAKKGKGRLIIMDNPTVDMALIRRKAGGLTHGLPVGLREWDGKDHEVNVYDAKTGE